MSTRRPRGTPAASSLISALLLILVLPITALAEQAQPLARHSWQLAKDPNLVVLELRRTPILLGEIDRTQTLRIFADGRVVVHQPAYLRAVGDYRGTLSAAELSDLLTKLDHQGLFALTEQALRQERQQRQEPLFEIHDGMQTSISIRLANYSAIDGSPTRTVDTTIAADHLQLKAERYPDAPRLAALAAAERSLLALVEKANLEPQTAADQSTADGDG